jgi:hypothetical protein
MDFEDTKFLFWKMGKRVSWEKSWKGFLRFSANIDLNLWDELLNTFLEKLTLLRNKLECLNVKHLRPSLTFEYVKDEPYTTTQALSLNIKQGYELLSTIHKIYERHSELFTKNNTNCTKFWMTFNIKHCRLLPNKVKIVKKHSF